MKFTLVISDNYFSIEDYLVIPVEISFLYAAQITIFTAGPIFSILAMSQYIYLVYFFFCLSRYKNYRPMRATVGEKFKLYAPYQNFYTIKKIYIFWKEYKKDKNFVAKIK